ncbi:hypothetical protein L686_13105 [Stutzerimonas stutzeri MF28]|nr:hypothetical protein L686_13105 [Stutzerimonas stutzeri MF28]
MVLILMRGYLKANQKSFAVDFRKSFSGSLGMTLFGPSMIRFLFLGTS